MVCIIRVPDSELAAHIEALGIASLTEWDVLAFVCRHGATLASAEHIGRLVGSGSKAARAALDSLTSLGLVQRSRNTRGVVLYRPAPAVPDGSRQRAMEELMKVADERQGRLLLLKYLRRATERKAPSAHAGLHLKIKAYE
jgi:hypothetical protein